jgi:hypothetical protein
MIRKSGHRFSLATNAERVFKTASPFEYFNDPVKTKEARSSDRYWGNKTSRIV